MKRRRKITLGVLASLTALWLAEPFIKEWFYKEQCSFGSVSKDDYVEILNRAKEINHKWDWNKRVPRSSEHRSLGEVYAPYLNEFLKVNLLRFIPETASTDIKVAHLLAFMEGFGARMYSKRGYVSRKEQKPTVSLNYVIYRMKLGEYHPGLLAPKSRYLKIHIGLQKEDNGNAIAIEFNVHPTGFLVIPLDDGLTWQSFKPVGCVEEDLFKSWGLSL